MKGYRLWCTETKPPKFIISRDVKFNESSMLHLTKELGDVEKENNVSKQVEVEIQQPEAIHESPLDQPIHEEEERRARGDSTAAV